MIPEATFDNVKIEDEDKNFIAMLHVLKISFTYLNESIDAYSTIIKQLESKGFPIETFKMESRGDRRGHLHYPQGARSGYQRSRHRTCHQGHHEPLGSLDGVASRRKDRRWRT